MITDGAPVVANTDDAKDNKEANEPIEDFEWQMIPVWVATSSKKTFAGIEFDTASC